MGSIFPSDSALLSSPVLLSMSTSALRCPAQAVKSIVTSPLRGAVRHSGSELGLGVASGVERRANSTFLAGYEDGDRGPTREDWTNSRPLQRSRKEQAVVGDLA